MTTNNFPYSLETPGRRRSIRYTCPSCNHRNVFTRYVVNETGEYLNDNIGRCSREIKCGYHYPPRNYFKDNNINDGYKRSQSFCSDLQLIQPPSFIDEKHMLSSLRKYDQNYFAAFLRKQTPSVADDLLKQYKVGTSYRWPASSVFWQIDVEGRVHAGKIMQYDRMTGKRIKQPENRITWMHKHLGLKDFTLNQCLFGEHLLKDNADKIVGVVESEKTAIIASAYLPMYTWVATGSIGNLNKQVCGALSGHKTVLYPDSDGFSVWREKAVELKEIADIEISPLLENELATEEKKQGLDLADYLLRYEFPN